MNYRKLRGKIREVYGAQDAFAADMGMNPSTMSAKLTGKTDWSIKEAELACRLLEISLEDMHIYFFTP